MNGSSATAALIDELGKLDGELQLMAPKEARRKVLKEELEQVVKNSTPGDQPATLRGALYELQYLPARRERTIVDRWKAWRCLTKVLGSVKAALAVIDIPLGAIDKNLPESISKEFIVEERSGWRQLTIVPLAPPEQRSLAA